MPQRNSKAYANAFNYFNDETIWTLIVLYVFVCLHNLHRLVKGCGLLHTIYLPTYLPTLLTLLVRILNISECILINVPHGISWADALY